MKADILTLKALFQKDARYVIPTFQRPYVWNQEEQWEPLWNDVRNVAEEYLENLVRVGTDRPADAERQTGSHFLGAVVVQQRSTSAREIETREVIDGQQRLTTLQLLLDATQEVFEQEGLVPESRLLKKLVLNDADLVGNDRDIAFKVWPTLVDQEPFRRAMTNELVVDGFESIPIVQAHEFFKLQVRQWLSEHPELAAERANGLVSALMGLLQMVVIDLDPSDDPNVIFETLNARGTPLLASDLVKNSVLHAASEAGLDSDALYSQLWKGFDDLWWRTEVRQGRIVRPRIDTYLNYWLIMRTGDEILSTDVFPRFRRYAEEVGPPITAIVQDMKDIATAYRELEQRDDRFPEGVFLYRWHVMDAGVSTPVVLWLLSNRTAIGSQGLRRALNAIEGYLVRRMICRMTTKDYNRLFLEMMDKVRKASADTVGELIVDLLARETAESRVWPSDARLREAILTLPLYQLLTRGRLRMVLEAIEDALRSPKSEEQHVPRGLTIEHIMPQGWRQHWPLPIGAPSDAPEVRDRVVQTLGNLTLVNDRLNPSMSNGPWTSEDPTQSKRHGLSEHSVLLLNREVLKMAPEQWDENLVRQRSTVLFESIASIWPSPAATGDTFTANSLSLSVDPPPSTPQTDIEAEFARHLLTGIQQCQELDYNPTAFRIMMAEHGAVGAVQRLLQPPVERCSDGFVKLWELKRLDLAVEYSVAFDERFRALFTDDERGIARDRLALYGVVAPSTG